MTTEAIANFAKAVQADEEMARGLAAAVGESRGADATEAFAAYACDHGYAITSGDVEALLVADQSSGDTLTDEQLDGVSGGISFRDILGIVPGTMYAAAMLTDATIGRVFGD